MEKMVENIIKIKFSEIMNITFPLGRFGLIVEFHDIQYKFILNLIEDSDKLIALGSGALGINSGWDRSRPRFSRWSWDFEESTINYDDPTLYINDEILASWCIGTENRWYLKDISEIIECISIKLNIEKNNLIFYGSSAGGFTSLMLSTLIKGSFSIAEIPQLDVTTWGTERHWVFIKKHCFNNQTDEEILSRFNYRFKLIELIKKEKYVPNAFIIEGSTDKSLQTQCIPFIREIFSLPFNRESNTITFYIHGKTEGHNVLEYEDFLEIFKKIKINIDMNTKLDNIHSAVKNQINTFIEGEVTKELNNVNSIRKEFIKKEKYHENREIYLKERLNLAYEKINLLNDEFNEKEKYHENREIYLKERLNLAYEKINLLENELNEQTEYFNELEKNFKKNMNYANNEITYYKTLLNKQK